MSRDDPFQAYRSVGRTWARGITFKRVSILSPLPRLAGLGIAQAHLVRFGRRSFRSALLLSLLLAFDACRESPAAAHALASSPGSNGRDDAAANDIAASPSWLGRDDGQWLRPAKDYASTRFSSLDQIDVRNAANLKLAFTFSTGGPKGHEAAPL